MRANSSSAQCWRVCSPPCALLMLIAAPAAVPHAAAGEPSSVPFLQVRIDRVTPEVVTTTSEPVVTVSRNRSSTSVTDPSAM